MAEFRYNQRILYDEILKCYVEMKKMTHFYTLTSKLEPSRRINDLPKDEKVLRKMSFGSKDPYLDRKILDICGSGSKDTRYLWKSSKDIFRPNPSFEKSDQLERSNWSNPSLTNSSFDHED